MDMKVSEMKTKILSVSIADCEVQTFRSGGKGGQNQNKRDTGVRIIHHPSGARAESREHRTQWQNKKAAWNKLIKSAQFRYWISVVTKKIKTEKEYLDEMMKPENIKTEVREDGAWKTVDTGPVD